MFATAMLVGTQAVRLGVPLASRMATPTGATSLEDRSPVMVVRTRHHAPLVVLLQEIVHHPQTLLQEIVHHPQTLLQRLPPWIFHSSRKAMNALTVTLSCRKMPRAWRIAPRNAIKIRSARTSLLVTTPRQAGAIQSIR